MAAHLGVQAGLLRFANLVLFILIGLAIGLAVRALCNRVARRSANTWAEFLFSLLAVLPVPLLLIAAIDVDLQILVIPRRYEHLWLGVSKTIVVIVLYVFPARAAVLFLRRLGKRKPEFEKTGRFLAVITEVAVALFAADALLDAFQPPRSVELWKSRAMGVVVVGLVCYALAKAVLIWLARLGHKDPHFVRVTEPAAFLTRAAFAVLAAIIILQNFGVHLTVVWTTLGVGSVAVGLALQDTLANFFAGMYILADRPITPGDFIQLDSGQQGYVVRVGWRSTLMRSLASNIVIVPNSTLSKAIIINYSQPEPSLFISVEVGVAYGTDPKRVKRVLEEIGEQAATDGVEGLDPSSKPTVRFAPGFGDSSLNFTLSVRVQEFASQYAVQADLRTRIVERFDQEGIEFPFPTRTIVFDKSTPALLALNHRPSGGERAAETEQEQEPVS
ncbi:MAG: mechanosensitive ion channel family protein [Terriglobia bacterium]